MGVEHPRTAGPLRAPSRREALAHADALYALAHHLARTPADAEDLVQETFARAFAAWDGFTPGTNLKAWLLRILRNCFLDRERHERLHPRGEADEATLESPAADAGESFLRGDRELESLRRVVGQEIEAAVRALREESRVVVLLDLEGLAEAEIAAVVGCPAGTVKSRLSRARSELRRRLAVYRR
jgi:RNA polymerase sigma-70 factor (ECF subfamily)